MKIIALQAENIKKLVAVEIRPDGNLVQITGKNGQGKTSVLDAIWWALCGAANIQGNPIRKGEDQARIRLDMGEIVVTRIFKKGAEGNTLSQITIENAEGTAIRQPQTMLDRLIGELSFDPLAFARMSRREQFDQLKRFVPDVDFEAIEKAHQEDYDKRTNVNRQAHEAKVMAESIFVALEADAKAVDEGTLVDELEAAGKHNTDIEVRRSNRDKMATEVGNKRKRAGEIVEEIKRLRAESDKLCEEANDIERKLEAAPPLPEPIDVSGIKERLAKAKKVNEQFALLKKRDGHMADHETFKAESDEITARMNQRTREKLAKIAAVKLPVEALSFGDSEILLNGVQFNQASDAEQLRVSIAIAMALNPKLRVIRVRDGSLLDEDSLKMLGEMAEAQDYQVWIERVDSSGKVGFVLEDGHIKTEVKQEVI